MLKNCEALGVLYFTILNMKTCFFILFSTEKVLHAKMLKNCEALGVLYFTILNTKNCFFLSFLSFFLQKKCFMLKNCEALGVLYFSILNMKNCFFLSFLSTEKVLPTNNCVAQTPNRVRPEYANVL